MVRPSCRCFGVLISPSHWLVTTIIVLISLSAYLLINRQPSFYSNSNQIDLIVLVLSARHNFDKRNVLRKTWFRRFDETYGDDAGVEVSIKPYFVVGKHDCSIPMEYREDEYDCKEWVYNQTEDLKTRVFSHSTQPISLENAVNSPVMLKGFSFKTHQDILLKKTGCHPSCHCDTIVLKNVITQEIFLNQSFSRNGQTQFRGYNYQEVSPILFLPKGYTWLLIATNSNDINCYPVHTNQWNQFTKLFQVLRVYNNLNDYESQIFKGDEIVFTSFVIELADQIFYHKMVEKQKEEHSNLEKDLNLIENRLQSEVSQHNDIILVNVVDVYRNLPKKLVNGIAWTMSSMTVDLILKTDDDCYIDLVGISRKISSLAKRQSIWWGNFRRNMLINIYGKWAEKDFPGSVYPSFACGSGYIISSDIANWIAQNKNYLHYFQGEDVSMGIWLSSIIPLYLMDRDWACAEDPPRDGQLAYCQLNSSQLIQFHKIKSQRYQM